MARGKLQDGDFSFLLGQNSSLAPDQLPPGFYARGMNVVNRGGIVQCRPGYRCLAMYPEGNFQGGALFKPKQGLASILFVVEGNLYLSEFPFKSYRQLADVAFSPTAREIFFKQVEQSVKLNEDESLSLIPPKNLMVIQDGGTSPAVVFDGTRAVAQTGDGKIPNGGPMEWVADRLWVARGAKLFASDIANPTAFTEPLYLATVDAFILPGTITALSRTPSAAQAQLLVFTQTNTTLLQAGIRDRSVWATTPDFQKEVFPEIGCVSQKSVVTHYGFLWWFSQHGLTSLDGAAQSFVTSELNYTDSEMTDSKARLSSDLSGIACSTYENYLLVSVPSASPFNTHTWVLDNTVMQLNRSAAPAWNGYWTGTRPVQWISANINGVNRSLYFSADYDGNTRLWEAFTPDRLDDGCPVTWWVETRGLNFGAVGKTKEFRYADLFVSELAGDVDFAIFWAGAARGKYKRILTKRVKATRGVWRSGEEFSLADQIFALKKQSRPLRTHDGRAIIAESTQSSCDVEAPAEEFRDEAFQLLLVGSGPGALRGYMQYVEPPTNTDDSGGGCPASEDETEENFVRFDGAAAEAHTFRDAYENLMTELPVFTSVRTETVSRDEFSEVGMGSAESIISQADADKIASAIAKRLASNRLEMSLPLIVSLGSTANERLDNSSPPDTTPGDDSPPGDGECGCLCDVDGNPVSDPFVTHAFDGSIGDVGSGSGSGDSGGESGGDEGGGGDEVPPEFSNSEQSFTASCPEGETGDDVTVTIPAGTYTADTQAGADALALAAATEQATAGLVCVPAEACIQWNQLLWSEPTYSGSSPETGETHSPAGGATGAAFQTTGFNTDVSTFNAQFSQDAFLDFNSPTDCENNLHFILASTFPIESDTVGVGVTVVRMDTFDVLLNVNYDGSNNGTYDFPFTLPAGNYQVRVRLEWGLNEFFDPGAGTVDMQGTLSNL